MDSIFGQLVDSEYSIKFKQRSIQEGNVRISSSDKTQKESFQPESYIRNGGSFSRALDYYLSEQKSTIQEGFPTKYYENSHEAFLRYGSKLKLPDDDDCSDLGSENLFGGIVTFGHFEHFNCFDSKTFHEGIDIAIVGAPFDTGVSFRPGARFGPNSIREASKRLTGTSIERGRGNKNSKLPTLSPYDPRTHNLSIIDCGDIPMTPFDNRIALNQLYRGERAIHSHTSSKKPRIITMGGDHTITLMALRSAFETYGKVSVLHFDSHIDSWDPKVLGGGISNYAGLNHGTFLHYAAEQGYLNEDECFHLGIRAPSIISGDSDFKHDHECGFNIITARDLDIYGKDFIVKKIKESIDSHPVYITVDIDVLDPSNAPGTGTMEIGGWTGRELLTVLDALEGLHVIGGDVVEVSPPYDSNSDITSLAATAVIDSLIGIIMVDPN